jgi:hypothetical protein
MAITAAILIALYIIGIFVAINWPRRRRHPEDRIADGCLVGVAVGLGVLGAILGIVVWLHARWAVNAIFVLTVFPVVVAGPQLAWAGIKALRRKAIARGTTIPPDQLRDRLSGHTHVSQYGSVDPPRRWSELRYYSPDGRVIDYLEEDGQTKLVPGDVTWGIEGKLFVTLNDHRPGNRNRYVLKETPDGQIAYYIHAPLSRLNGRLSRRTAAVRPGEPVTTL